MAVLKEWRCFDHGEFDSTHPICPYSGCDSSAVLREFRTAPTIGTRMVRQHHEGMKRTSDMMKINNFRTAREGEAAYGGEAAKEAGMQVLWGDESKKALGKGFAELTQIANRPFTVNKRDGSGSITLTRNNAMADAAEQAGITRRRVAKPGELRVPKGEARSETAAKTITS